jgi:predicted ATPase
MGRLLGIRITNYRALADVRIGQVEYAKGTPLPRLACFIGPNGAGKSTLLDAFGFIGDCLHDGVEAACDRPQRGGFEKLRTQGSTEPIEFELFFDDEDPARPIVYNVSIDLQESAPRVVKEELRQRRKSETRGKPKYFLKLKNGAGKVWAGDKIEDEEGAASERVSLSDPNKLGITTLGNIKDHPRIVRLRQYIEGWYLSYFVPDAARELPVAGAQRHLDRKGSNVGNVLQYFQRQGKAQLNRILKEVTSAIPGLTNVKVEPSQDGRLLLRFDERGYVDPFYQQSMSDGTLKMLAYAVLFADPEPRPFIGIEEPENGLYVELVERLASLFRKNTENAESGTQVLVTTHSPYFVDALVPEQVWIVRKNDEGHSTVESTADLPSVKEMVAEGIPLGSLWYSKHLGPPA